MSLASGTKLGRYEIRSHLGAGGMGEVYHDRELDRTVAIKILPEDVASDHVRLQRFIQEARAASALNHPHILTIYEIGITGTSRFIAAEFVDGVTLRERIDAGIGLAEILEISIQAASALAAAHQVGIIHRDVKPENIMVRRDGYIKLLDFGLAKLTLPLGSSSSSDTEAATKAMLNTNAGAVIGTTKYMSPEQAKGINVDARTDLWSLGVLIYEMVTQHEPFGGDTPTETISLIMQREYLPVSHFVRAVPPDLERIISQALTKNRDERHQSATELLRDLRNLKRQLDSNDELDRSEIPDRLDEAPLGRSQRPSRTASGRIAATAATPSSLSSAEYIVSGIKQHKLIAGIAILLLVIGALTLGGYLRGRNSELAIESIAVLPFENQNQDPNTDYLSDGVTESIINSLAQLPNVKVIARSSVFRYKGKGADPLVAGKELGVRVVLTGRIMQRGDDLAISTELLDVRDNKQLWGEQYNEKVSDLLSMQRTIASQITGNLRVKLTGADQGRLTKHYTENTDAYQLYLKGRFLWNKRTAESIEKSIDYFNQAIERDPNYALAYAGLADAWFSRGWYRYVVPKEAYERREPPR